jgi:lysozyme
MKITEEEADRILSVDLAKVEKQVAQYITKPLTQNQFDALVSFTFNLGPGNLSRSSMARRLNAGDYMVSNEFAKWNRAGGDQLKGLTRRRMAEAAMWDGDVAGSLRLAGVNPPPPDIEPVWPKSGANKHTAAGTAGAATGAALNILGLPLWAVISAAFVVAIAVYLIVKNRK